MAGWKEAWKKPPGTRVIVLDGDKWGEVLHGRLIFIPDRTAKEDEEDCRCATLPANKMCYLRFLHNYNTYSLPANKCVIYVSYEDLNLRGRSFRWDEEDGDSVQKTESWQVCGLPMTREINIDRRTAQL